MTDRIASRAPLCPGIERFIEEAAEAFADSTGEESLAEQRAAYAFFSERFRQPRPEGLSAEDAVLAAGLGDVPVRIYWPPSLERGKLAPCILYMHGGGWVLGSVDTHDCITAEIAESTSAIVVSVDYALAPEHPFPAGFNQCFAALHMLADNGAAFGIDATRIAVAGDSAGANLAAALALAARDAGGPALIAQALIYPVLGTDRDLPSYVENANAPLLKTEEMAVYWAHYLNGKPATVSPYAAPLLAADLSGLPPALIWTAGYDPVRDDGEVFAYRLREAGVPATYRCARDLAHGYLRARAMSASAAAEFEALCGALRELLRQPLFTS
jgi:acetyl esterase